MRKSIDFYKFDGAGNDFVIVDARQNGLELSSEEIARICHRRFGVGADGLMALHEGGTGCDFEMRYYNSDGCSAAMCGNGARCIAVFAYLLGIGSGSKELRFAAQDGMHHAEIVGWDADCRRGTVCVGMKAVSKSEMRPLLDGVRLDTGVPHYVQWVRGLDGFDVVGEGRRLRRHPLFDPAGANINFVERQGDGSLHVRTYERGVEDETWSCGTGVTACALVSGTRRIRTAGGEFCVDYVETDGGYSDIRLTGPVSLNFIGTISIP